MKNSKAHSKQGKLHSSLILRNIQSSKRKKKRVRRSNLNYSINQGTTVKFLRKQVLKRQLNRFRVKIVNQDQQNIVIMRIRNLRLCLKNYPKRIKTDGNSRIQQMNYQKSQIQRSLRSNIHKLRHQTILLEMNTEAHPNSKVKR